MMSNVVPLFPKGDSKSELTDSLHTLNNQIVALKTVTEQLETAGYEPNEVREKQAEVLKAMSSRLMWLSYNLHQQARTL